ncbi:MAG: hypothetical protein GX993_04690 [Bacteroidales bacterium]|nr:hypothetical protein [Bacteroidales bacterium]
MKKIAIIIFAIVLSFPAFSQGKYGKDSVECTKYLSFYSELYKQRNYDEAAPHWRKAISLCPPTASQNMLLHGQNLLRQDIRRNAKNPARRQELIDSLIMLHDLRAEYYPNNRVRSMDNKAIDIINYNYCGDDPLKQYQLLTEIINTINVDCSPVVFINQMKGGVALYQNGALSAEDLMNCFENNICFIEDMIAMDPEKEEFRTVKQDIETIFAESGVATCENLIDLYTPRFEANPKDANLLATMVKMLTRADCVDTDLFLKSAVALHEINPSSNSAYGLYRLYSSRNENAVAAQFLESALSLLDPNDTKTAADYNLELATFYFKNLSRSATAVATAKKAIEYDQSIAGKAYLLIGTIWASQDCQGSEVDVRSKYWVAVDYMVKAKNADPEVAEHADELAAQYRRYFPMQVDAFMYDVTDGQRYTVSCGGMTEITTVRTQK